MKKLVALFASLAAAALVSPAFAGSPSLWQTSVPFANAVASSSATTGGGYPDDASGAPIVGKCGPGTMTNRSESWVAVQPGTENLVGSSKFFFDKWSTFYNFYLGAYTIPNGKPAGDAQIGGYDCVSNGTQAMPPDWTNVTDPNVAFDSQGRAYQVTLPFNAYWTNMHPNGAIGVVYSDDLGRSWQKGNGGDYLDSFPNSSSFSFGGVVDKQWIAVNSDPLSVNRDHVYAFWANFNGDAVQILFSKSTDRGATFTPAEVITPPNEVGPSTTYVYPSIDSAGTIYVAVASFPAKSGATDATLYTTHSTDDGATWAPWISTGLVARGTPGCCFPNTTFRDGILENFTASPTYPGHLYMAYEDWNGTQMDVRFSQSTDGGVTWSPGVVVNDDGGSSDQFQPSVAAGPGGAVAVAFYDRRAACPADRSVLPQDVGRQNFCVDVSLQAYRDGGSGAVPVGHNVRISKYTWDPQQPGQTIGGLPQLSCSSHSNPCRTSFIGDYFGLAISGANVYALSVSTHYPSGVTGDGGAQVYYQQQVLATVARSALGL